MKENPVTQPNYTQVKNNVSFMVSNELMIFSLVTRTFVAKSRQHNSKKEPK